jgi:hypothetical protein
VSRAPPFQRERPTRSISIAESHRCRHIVETRRSPDFGGEPRDEIVLLVIRHNMEML